MACCGRSRKLNDDGTSTAVRYEVRFTAEGKSGQTEVFNTVGEARAAIRAAGGGTFKAVTG